MPKNKQGEQKQGDWGDLGLGPRRKPADIPGPTPWERRHAPQTTFDLEEQAAGGRAARRRLVVEVATKCGLTENAARDRVRRFARGKIDRKALFAPKHVTGRWA